MFAGQVLEWAVGLRVLGCCARVLFLYSGTWCSGITSALHAEGPGFNPQCVHRFFALSGGYDALRCGCARVCTRPGQFGRVV
jgi:hypothetical protein